MSACMRQHTSAYVSIRQHTAEGVPRGRSRHERLHTSAYVSIRQHTAEGVPRGRSRHERLHMSAYVSIRQHTSAYGGGRPTGEVAA